jgi:hypothetical protein
LKIASQKAVNIAEASHYEFLELFELGVENIPSRRENLIADAVLSFPILPVVLAIVGLARLQPQGC